jgi:Zn ribbon nucleic-acid-binding protein
MANISKPLALRCPECSHDGARTVVRSFSIITVACVHCKHQRTVEIARLPVEVRAQLPEVEDRATSGEAADDRIAFFSD